MKNYVDNYKRLLRFLKGHLGEFLLASFLMLFSAVFGGVSIGMIVPIADKILSGKSIILPPGSPPFLLSFIDKVNSLERIILLKYVAIFMVVLFLIKSVFMFFQNYLMNDVGLKIVTDIRNKIFEKIQRLSLDFFERRHSGQLSINIISDTELVQHAITYALNDFVYQGFQVIVFLGIALFINLKLTLISLLVFPSIIFPIAKLGKRIKKFTTRSQEELGQINKVILENITSQRIIKGFNLEGIQISKFKSFNYNIYKFRKKMIKRLLVMAPLTEFVGSLMAVMLFLVGGREVILGKISFGVFGLFLGSLLSMIRPLKKLSSVHSINQRAFAASERIYSILDYPSEITERKDCRRIREFKDEIVFDDVHFRYSTGDWVLKGINLVVRKGEKLAIVGQSGEGKTTLVNLLPRFYDPQKGRILIDGLDLRNVCIKDLRFLIGIVTQEPIVFNTTVEENISYGRPGASSQEIREAAQLAFADEFIRNLPQQYKTIIGERGFTLSGGEKQRLCIARAILKNPQILILDEATSQLDSESERIVQEALSRLMEGRTVFIIAHRLSTIRDVSRIIVLDKGKVVEEGSHQFLMEKGKFYPYLYNLQFSSNSLGQ